MFAICGMFLAAVTTMIPFVNAQARVVTIIGIMIIANMILQDAKVMRTANVRVIYSANAQTKVMLLITGMEIVASMIQHFAKVMPIVSARPRQVVTAVFIGTEIVVNMIQRCAKVIRNVNAFT